METLEMQQSHNCIMGSRDNKPEKNCVQMDNNVADLSYLAFVAQENVIKSRMRIIQPYHMDMGQLLNKKIYHGLKCKKCKPSKSWKFKESYNELLFEGRGQGGIRD